MAAPLTNASIDREGFERIKDKATQQLSVDNPMHCDTETMALMVAYLNHKYYDKSVYFALLNMPGMDTATFPVFLFYCYDNGFWSVAYIARRLPMVTVFDGISTLPTKVAVFGDTDVAQSSVLCVAWAEAKYKEQRMPEWWNAKKKLCCWTPATDDLVEAELKIDSRWPWIYVLYDRTRNAEFGVLAGI